MVRFSWGFVGRKLTAGIVVTFAITVEVFYVFSVFARVPDWGGIPYINPALKTIPNSELNTYELKTPVGVFVRTNRHFDLPQSEIVTYNGQLSQINSAVKPNTVEIIRPYGNFVRSDYHS